MSRCGYYFCFKGKPTCKHPTYGDTKTQCMRTCGAGGGWHPCDMCRMDGHGIYPSEVPQSSWSGTIEVIDRDGNVLN